MAAPYHLILSKVQTAVEAYVTANAGAGTQLNGITIVTGMNLEALTGLTQRIEILCPKATAEKEGDFLTGNWWVDLQVSYAWHTNVVTHAQAQLRYGALVDLFMVEDLPAALNALSPSDLTILGGGEGDGEGCTAPELQVLVSELMLKNVISASLYCMPS